MGLWSYLRKLVSISQHTRLPTFKKVPPSLPPKSNPTFKKQALANIASEVPPTKYIALTCRNITICRSIGQDTIELASGCMWSVIIGAWKCHTHTSTDKKPVVVHSKKFPVKKSICGYWATLSPGKYFEIVMQNTENTAKLKKNCMFLRISRYGYPPPSVTFFAPNVLPLCDVFYGRSLKDNVFVRENRLWFFF